MNQPNKFSSLTSKNDFSLNPKKRPPYIKIAAVAVVAILVFAGMVFILFSVTGDEEPTENQPQESQTTQTTSTKTEKTTSPTTAEEESEELDNFSTENQEIGSKSVKNVSISNFEGTSEEGSYSISFILDSDKIPQTTAVLQESTNVIDLTFSGVSSDNSGIAAGGAYDISDSIVSSIYHHVKSGKNTSKYSIGIKEETSFRLYSESDPTRVVLEIKEKDVKDKNGKDFEFSTKKQTVKGTASGNVVTLENLAHVGVSGEGVFRFIWSVDTIGDGKIPNASAQIVDYKNGKAIKLVMNNMASDFAASDDYNVKYDDNAVKHLKGSYSSGVSTYYILLTSKRDFKLYYRKAPAQVIVDVKY